MVIEWMPHGMLAMFQTSPASQRVQTISQLVTAGQRREFADFQDLLCQASPCVRYLPCPN
jgi:hypothetical protein